MTIDPGAGRRRAVIPNEREALRPLREVLDRQERADVVVEPDTEVDLEPDGEYGPLFHRVELASFNDLTALKLVPEELDEGSVRAAIGRDDVEALSLSRDLVRAGMASRTATCACGGHSEPDDAPAQSWLQQQTSQTVALDYRSHLSRTYEAVRKAHHPALAEAVSESTGRRIRWDDPELTGIHRWATLIEKAWLIAILLIQDLTIGKNATLNVSSQTTSMLVNDIRIHAGGRMVIKSPFISINCASVRGSIP